MREQLLTLVPKRFLCPYCGKWHDWGETFELSSFSLFEFDCPFIPESYYHIFFEDGNFCYYVEPLCDKIGSAIDGTEIEGEIPVSSIIESEDKPVAIFEVPFESVEDVGSHQCSDCAYKSKCNFAKLGDEGDHRHISITLGFEFDQAEYDEICGKGEKVSKTIRRVPGKEDNVSKNIRRIVT